MQQVSNKKRIFGASILQKDRRHRGELLSFSPSENLENSCCMGESLNAVPPVEHILCSLPSGCGSHAIFIYRCELIFILYATGIPEPSDEGCQEGSHSLCCG